MSKAELARAAGISPLTVDRVEKGYNCRLSTKRKIIRALGIELEKAQAVFPTFSEEQKTGDPPGKKTESAPNGNVPKKKKAQPSKKEASADGGERSATTTSP
jgi:DNA-binding XRE family transcriptional regulator